MAIQAQYKKYNRSSRLANVETDFSKGMMYSENVVSEGYVKTLVNFDFTTDGRNALKPRAALVTSELILPDMSTSLEDDDYFEADVALKYSKECVEDGDDYRQFILGKPDIDEDGEPLDSGKIWVVTSKKSDLSYNDIKFTASDICADAADCRFYNTKLTEIHDTELTPDSMTSFPVGSFLGNSFYFFGTDHKLKRTFMDSENYSPGRYIFEDTEVQAPTASEAVNYGYNMLKGEVNASTQKWESGAYIFDDAVGGASTFQMQGILPYDSKFETGSSPELLMSPKANSRVWFRCNYDIPINSSYNITWSWKEVTADEWTAFHTEDSFTPTEPLSVLQADLIVPAKAIMVRCEAYLSTDPSVVETAMTVGFDFSIDEHGSTANLKPISYDLSTATGMINWKNRLVVWGVPQDPTILFVSDLDEPGYFPYPNNVTVFDEPIIAVTELMDNLIVFTRSKIHQVALNTDGISWISTVIQSNLRIDPWDKHLIQTVRNMLYFKSGNYYYMLVPKAQSTTGELTLAPITTPITDFFNHFSANVSKIFRDCFKYVEDEEIVINIPEDLITYYNFIDYELIHNFYVYKYNDVLVHFDITYNTVDRYWKINVYEAMHLLFPFRNDATQQGLLAGTSVMSVEDTSTSETGDKRVIQLFRFDSLSVQDNYILAGTEILYDMEHSDITYQNELITINDPDITYANELVTLDNNSISQSKTDDEVYIFASASNFVDGFNTLALYESFLESLEHLKENTIFPNKQMLDTGYRDSALFLNKRYRELQLQINNMDDVDMEFGMDFQISGEPRNTDFIYEVSQTIDELTEEFGIAYLEATPYLSDAANTIEKVNQWTIKHSLTSGEDYNPISLWKVRASVSGKGTAPRLRLFTRNQFNYQLLGINWIYREMNMR